MFRISVYGYAFFLLACCVLPMAAQQPAAVSANVVVPRLVNFSGVLTDGNSKPLTGVVGVTFYLYQEQQGGSPLWMETQNIHPDGTGHYAVQLGSATSQGLPASIFASGEAHWLGVQVQGREEQPRVLLLSVPYALKAADAETVGGLPPSAFLMAAPGSANTGANGTNPGGSNAGTTAGVTGSGTADFVPLWTSSSILGNSVMFQSGSGSSAKLGINETTPLTTLDVNGTTLLRGLSEMATINFATPTKAYNSNPFNFESSAYSSSLATNTLEHFQWQSEPTGNNTTHPGATLNLLFGIDPAAPAETGLKLSSTGVFTFASGQTFPGAGTVTSVGSGAGLTGGPITTSGTLSIASGGVTNAMLVHPSLTVAAGTDLTGGGSVALGGTTTLNLDITKIPQLGTNNTFAGVQTLNGGALLGSSIQADDGTFSLLINSVDCCTFGTRMIWAHSPAFPNWGIYYDDNVDYMHIRTGPGGEILTVDFGGLVGINNATPGQALDVNGNINTNSSVLAAGDLDANGNVNISGGVNSSGRGTFGSSGATGQIVIANNAGGTQALQIQNFTDPVGGFTEAQFDEFGDATFFTDAHGDTTAIGTKSAAVPLNGNMVKVFSTESPEVWFEDYGFGQLTGGAGRITIDPSFAQTVSLNGYHVFVTPKGDCKGLYVTNETNSGFEVRELGGGLSSVAFDYRIVAHRKGYEALRLPVAKLPKAAPVTATTEKHVLALAPATVRPNPQAQYHGTAPVRKQAPRIAPQK